MKKIIRKYIGALFLTTRFYMVGVACITLFVLRYFLPVLGIIPVIALWAFLMVVLVEYILLFSKENLFTVMRTQASRLSNGDDNTIKLYIENNYNFSIHATIIDEIPFQFQRRDIHFDCVLHSSEKKVIEYKLHPVRRGVYQFGKINSYISCLNRLIQRRLKTGTPTDVPVYPSYIQLRKFQLLAFNHHLHDIGLKRQRHLGNSFEFDQIKDYVNGDDYRTVNWKATARRGQMMVNSYMEEKSQPIYSLIDKGRLMEMPFEGMSLLDYAINATLVLSSIALYKEDKAGLITFSKNIDTFLPTDRKNGRMIQLQELLYTQETSYPESDFERLFISVKHHIGQRSLLILFTNFQSLEGMRRQLPYLIKMNQSHLLLVVFFHNSVIGEILQETPTTVKEIYTQAIAEQFDQEKRIIVRELQTHGIRTLLTQPQQLTVNVINRYLEIKSKGSI